MKKMKFTIVLLISAVACTAKCENTNSDDFYEPCKSDIDLTCVRKYFSKNSDCSVVEDVNENTFYGGNLPINVPNANITVISTKTYMWNFKGHFEQFYINKKTGNLVMSINFDGLKVHAPDAIFAVSQIGKEPIVFSEFVNATYPMVLTANIPTSNGLNVDSLKNTEYFAYFPNREATVIPGPKFTKTKDPTVSSSLKAFVADVPTAIQEIYQTKASFDFLTYLQNYVCDFDIAPVIHDYDTTVLLNVEENKSEETSLMELCGQRDNIRECASHFFSELGTCSIVSQPSNEPVNREKVEIFVPSLNGSLILKDSQLSGLDGNIEQFYINPNTGNLVMSVSFDNITVDSPVTHVVMDEEGEEPEITTDRIVASYSLTLTVVIPVSEKLTTNQLKKSLVSEYSSESGTFQLGPKITESKDLEVVERLTELASHTSTVTREILATEGRNFFFLYLQKYVCDFGIPM